MWKEATLKYCQVRLLWQYLAGGTALWTVTFGAVNTLTRDDAALTQQMEHWQNDTDKGRSKWSSEHLSSTNLTRTDLNSAKGRRGMKFGTHSVHTHTHTHRMAQSRSPCRVVSATESPALQLPACFAMHHVQQKCTSNNRKKKINSYHRLGCRYFLLFPLQNELVTQSVTPQTNI